MLWLFASTLLLSSSLLFLLEPMCAKMLLPTLGGTPGVWNACMVFFQGGLLLGYCYAHFGVRFLGEKGHVFLQLLVLALAFLSLPVMLPRAVAPPGWPELWLIQTLVATVGLPFFVVASSGPLLQRWFVLAGRCPDPYFLYAASNLGSLAALVLYPSLLEPRLTLQEQGKLWLAGYAGLVVLCLACAACVLASAARPASKLISVTPRLPQTGKPTPALPLKWGTRLRWVVLALVPSSLMLSVTAYLTTDIAAIPLLWVIPLGLYLLTFALVFARKPLVPHQTMIRWMPLVVIVLAIMLFLEAREPLLAVLGLHLVGLLWLALVCHGELAHTRPPAERLTEFYLWLAIGGALGGLFNALVAPLIFNSLAEYPLMIALACFLRPAPSPSPLRLKLDVGLPLLVGGLTLTLVLLGRTYGLEPGPISVAALFVSPLVLVYLLQSRPVGFGLGLSLVFLASTFYPGVHGPSSYRQRSFFGVHRVTEQGGFRKLFHGHILHGQQSLDPRRRAEPLTYYYPTGPIGQLLSGLRGDVHLKRVGLVGLGTGALASYAEAGEHWTFFELDPAVAHIAAPATGLFTYLKDSRGRIDVVLGDARLTMSRQPDQFGVLVIDAFGSDAIPLHLLTREALQLYRDRLEDHGILAFHISNRYVDLEPVLANLAASARPPMVCRIQRDLEVDDKEMRKGKSPSVWVLLALAESDLGVVAKSLRWQAARARPELGVWTDDFSNLVSVLRWAQ